VKHIFNYNLTVEIEEKGKKHQQDIIDSLIRMFEFKMRAIVLVKNSTKLNVTKIEGEAVKSKETRDEFRRVRDRLEHKE